MDGYVDRLLRRDAANVSTTTPAPASVNSDETRNELGRLLTSSFRSGGDVATADRTYVAQVVAAQTGLSQADAERRVTQVITDAKASIDEARKAAIKLALWLTAAFLLGAFASSLAATEGGGLRDGTWNSRNKY
jgi:hypothetical protein